MCTGIPATQAVEVPNCEDCQCFRDGECRGRDPKVPVQVMVGVMILGVIFLTATVFS